MRGEGRIQAVLYHSARAVAKVLLIDSLTAALLKGLKPFDWINTRTPRASPRIQSRRLVGPAPVLRYLPKLIGLAINRTIDPAKVFDLTLSLEQVAEGFGAMNARRANKTLLRP